MIHDVQLNYYGKRLATCSSDGTVRVFDIQGQQQQLNAVLKEHEGPVWQVAWAHPKFGNILASCSYDGSVLVWKESDLGWSVIKKHNKHSASVNSIAWAPHELGPVLACGSSDGNVSFLSFSAEGTWEVQMLTNAHPSGVNTVNWAPATAFNALAQPSSAHTVVKQLATGGCDNLVKIWSYNETSKTYELAHTLAAHNDWVRDVAFAPNIGLGRIYLASCSQDRTVILWSQELSSTDASGSAATEGVWTRKPLTSQPFADVVWRLSWSLSGNVLAVSCGDNKISLWKEGTNGEWTCTNQMDEKGVLGSSGIIKSETALGAN
ncbi:Protein transport protein SEC13 [Zancudomyces culisetae]|uniref:Protein transport protein SEC13 n=1 Tax=Zancudomyces culisetae TaxID=1213189 RepID=A0A1R1PZ43_ZANCU|nr:Protein transport protein SEC13 [Zancudomyces culisetae]|eukprot:OMH86211.1 Protein transport protein SEC13 [Zancudomyces culisetae]